MLKSGDWVRRGGGREGEGGHGQGRDAILQKQTLYRELFVSVK